MINSTEHERILERYIIDDLIRVFSIEKQNEINTVIEEFKTFSRTDVLSKETLALLIFFYNK